MDDDQRTGLLRWGRGMAPKCGKCRRSSPLWRWEVLLSPVRTVYSCPRCGYQHQHVDHTACPVKHMVIYALNHLAPRMPKSDAADLCSIFEIGGGGANDIADVGKRLVIVAVLKELRLAPRDVALLRHIAHHTRPPQIYVDHLRRYKRPRSETTP